VAILDNAVKQKVPASLAFAIAYEESRFDPLAVNQNTTSVDRGLFQLNSLTFPDLTDQEFFNPSRNAREGIGYFRHVLELSGNEVSALAMYNAGRTRVTKQGAPMRTLDYISRILNYKKNIDSLFTAKVVAKASMVAKIRMGMLEQRSASIQ
jgi:soluble lytic murein transglycosylase-like protein